MSTTGRIIPPLPVTERGIPCNSFSCVDGALVFGSGSVISVHPSTDSPATVNHHGAKVTAASISLNGLWVATGDAKGMVKLWSAKGERVQKYDYRPIASGVRAICWSPDNRRIAVVGGESGRGGEGICISYDTGSAAGQAFSGHSKPITCVAFRPIPPFRIMTGSEDTSVVFHEGPPFKFMKSCQNAHTNFVNAVAFSPDGSRAFSCGSDGIVAVYSGDAGELLTVLNPKLSCSIWGIAPGIRGEVFAACGDKKIRSITGETCELINELVVGEGELKDMPLGITSDISMNTVTCITFDGTVRQFTVGENSELIPKSSLIGSSGPISAIIAQKDVVYVTSVDGSIWTLAKPFISGAISKINPKKPIKGSAGLIVDLMEVLGVSATQNELINIKTGDVKKIPIPNMTQRLVACKPVGYAIGDRSLKLSQIHQPCKSFEIPDSSESIGAFGVSLDGEVIVVAPHKDRSGMDQSGREILINMRTRIKTTITGSDIVNIAVNPDGSLIAVASGAHDIHVYKREGQGNSCNYVLIPETAKVWNYHRSRIACMQWADKTSLVTGGLDKNIYVWDVDRAISGPVTSLKDQHKEGVSALFASRDNGALHIVSGGNEGCVRVNIV